MHIEALLHTLKTLKLHGMMQSIQELSAQNSPAYQQALPILTTLLKAEVSDREVRSIAYQMKTARFPAYRDLYGFDFTGVDGALLDGRLADVEIDRIAPTTQAKPQCL